MPHSRDDEYAQRAIPQYEHAVTLAGGEPVRILLDQATDDVEEGHCNLRRRFAAGQ